MKTLVSEINGRKDFPVFDTEDNSKIIEHLKQTDWYNCDVEINDDGSIEVCGQDWEDTFRIIDTKVVELDNSNKNHTYRVYAEVSTRCYLDVQASSEEEALQMGEDADGGDFISEEGGGDWSIYQATKIS